uniref:Uncharacterized protein n=1 Tax=Myotis lucifugus TaxID=59463 RepID=G1P142_MYOLU
AAAAAPRRPAEDPVTFDDVAVYFSRREWRLLDEAQRRLYHEVMLDNLALASSLGPCCGAEDADAPCEQSVSVGGSPSSTSQAVLSSLKTHFCESCGPVLRDIFQLAEHQGTPHSQNVVRCGVGRKQFYLGANFQIHQKQHLAKKPFGSCVDRALLVKSDKFHVSEKPFPCDEVGKDFLATSKHLQQQRTPTGEEPNKTPQCWATVQNRKSRFTWGDCKKAFSPRKSHARVPDVHTGRQCVVRCERGKTFRDRSSFAVQQRVPISGKRRVCGQCGQSFRRTSTLNQHRRFHCGPRQYKCGKCEKSFTHSLPVFPSLSVHSGCMECGKSFSERIYLIVQRRPRRLVRTHFCESCGPVLRDIFQLAEHQGTPHSQNVVRCEVGRKQFYLGANFQNHQKQHLAKKPFRSCVDTALLVKSDKFNQHRRFRGGPRQYKCRNCGKSFHPKSVLI